MKKLLLLLPLFMLGVACSNDEGTSIESLGQIEQPDSFSVELMSKQDMPYWLAKKVQDLEDNMPPLAQYKVYQCVWKENTVYYIWSYLSSCIYDETYDQYGVRLDWEKYDFKDFSANSHDWKLIYSIKA